MCETNPVKPDVNIDELSLLIGRCETIALGLSVVLSRSTLPNGPEREGLCYEMVSIIEESAKKANRLVSAL